MTEKLVQCRYANICHSPCGAKELFRAGFAELMPDCFVSYTPDPTLEPEPVLMICPKAGSRGDDCIGCPSLSPHARCDDCENHEAWLCPACVPYEPPVSRLDAIRASATIPGGMYEESGAAVDILDLCNEIEQLRRELANTQETAEERADLLAGCRGDLERESFRLSTVDKLLESVRNDCERLHKQLAQAEAMLPDDSPDAGDFLPGVHCSGWSQCTVLHCKLISMHKSGSHVNCGASHYCVSFDGDVRCVAVVDGVVSE